MHLRRSGDACTADMMKHTHTPAAKNNLQPQASGNGKTMRHDTQTCRSARLCFSAFCCPALYVFARTVYKLRATAYSAAQHMPSRSSASGLSLSAIYG